MAESRHTNVFLTNFATNYRANESVADFLAPPFKVNRPSDKYVEYDKSWLRIYDAKISGRMEGQEIEYGTSEATYNCEEYELSKFVSSRLRRNTDKPINLDTNAVKHLKDAMSLAREYRVNQIAGSGSIVTQTSSPAVKWDVVATGIPMEDIKDALATIWSATNGKKANKIMIPFNVALGISKTDNFKDYFKYTSSDKLFDVMDGLRNLGLEPMITNMFGVNTDEGTGSDPAIESVWGENVVIFYSEPTPTLESRTFMYSPFTIKTRYEVDTKVERRGDKHFLYEEIDELLVDASCAYLFTNTLT